MTLSAGSRFGPYEIFSALGAGGMGEVYRARDTKLNRDVAIKVLPDHFASDRERLARFHREAQVLAALNHPNIAHIHGFEEVDGIHALVMELVDGPTLAEQIARGPVPLADGLAIAKQIAEALEAAHDQGIVHRDLKPANIKLRPRGAPPPRTEGGRVDNGVSADDLADCTVKVLDFGLAKALEPAAVGGDATASPTITSPAMTQMGVILGTAAYMSPEQAKGRAADKRSDVWAFGAVLYEMLSGRRPFEGEDLSDTLAGVLKSEPDWNALPENLPLQIRRLIQRCLAKDRRQRVADFSTVSYVLSESAGPGSSAPVIAQQVSASRRPLWRRLVVPTAAAVAAGAAVGAALLWLAPRPGPPRVTRFTLSPTGSQALHVDTQSHDLAITPDGTHIIYKGGIESASTRLFRRPLSELEPTPLTVPGLPRGPFLSPEGQWVGFFEPGPLTLKKVAITGGPVLRICGVDGASRGATWGDDGTIIFATVASSTGLQRVSSAGGEPTTLTTPNHERGESDHLWPYFLPGSQAVLFTITATTGGMDASQVAVLDLATGTQKILLRGGSQAHYVQSGRGSPRRAEREGGHLVYVAAGTLRAVPFDLERLEAIGSAVPVLSQVMTLPTGTAEFDIAQDGTLVYVAPNAGAQSRTLVWVDRQGREEAVKEVPDRPYLSPRLSPDGTRVALEVRDQENDIWVWDFARETLTKITSDAGVDQAPAWMPDGLRLVFSSQAGGVAGSLFWQSADGTGTAERLTQSPNVQRTSAVLADATGVLFWEAAATTATDVMMISLDKDHRVQPIVQTPLAELYPEVSPDGRWLAYQSNDSGQFQISVRPFPSVNEGKIQVSTVGGTEPLWARKSQELFYRAPGGAVMSVLVGSGATWTAGTPTKLFDRAFVSVPNSVRTYDVAPDGKRFLMLKQAGPDQTPTPPSVVVVQNWTEELRRLAPITRPVSSP